METLISQKYPGILDILMLLIAINTAHNSRRRVRKLDQATIVLYTSFDLII
jgi:hypothetical protein